MPTDRVLVEIVTAANMTGIKEAQAGFLKMSSALSASIVGLGILAVASKSAIDISEKREKAEKDLTQALESRGLQQSDLTSLMYDFIDANRAYISDQSEVIDGYATLTRSGLSVSEVQRDMNRAVDIAALKHISLSEAVALVNNAEHGRLRGLVDLGITSKAYVDSSGNVIEANKNMAKVMDELDKKTAHGRDTTTQMSQATNKLSNDWEDIANTAGPPLISTIDAVAGGVDWVLRKLKELGQDKGWNQALYVGFGQLQNAILNTVKGVQELIDGIKWLASHPLVTTGGGQNLSLGSGSGHRAGGGPVLPGSSYSVGENGTEMLTMFPGGGGYVTPGGGGGGGGAGRIGNVVNLHIHVDQGAYIDGPSIDRLANLILQRGRFAPGT